VTIDVTLDVVLKSVDLVANTAMLTLCGKMGYKDKLLGLQRLDSFGFSIETKDPKQTLTTLKRVLNTQATFYNRNKHNYLLRCSWDGEEFVEGIPPEEQGRELTAQVRSSLTTGSGRDFNGADEKNRVILQDTLVFKTDVLVEDVDSSAKEKISRKLETELSTAPVVVHTLGTWWQLALAADSDEDARALAREIVVTERRDRGLLLNPNYQGFRFLGVEKIELTE
jgi:hypothetical protein